MKLAPGLVPAVLCLVAATATAQQFSATAVPSASGASPAPSGQEVTVDGFLEEWEWSSASDVANRIAVRMPDGSAAIDEGTVVRAMYDAESIYIAAQVGSAPLAASEGGFIPAFGSDWLIASFMSCSGPALALEFAVSRDGEQELRLDGDEGGVPQRWEAGARTTSYGWSAEIRIALAELNAGGPAGEILWDIGFERLIGSSDGQLLQSCSTQL